MNNQLPFGKTNYLLMLVGIAIIFLGFAIMSMDKAESGFGFFGLTLGPLITFFGFMFEFYALFKKK